MDIITASEPQVALAVSSATLLAAETPSSGNPIAPLNLIDRPKARTTLRLYAILSALYVIYPTRVIGEDHLTNNLL